MALARVQPRTQELPHVLGTAKKKKGGIWPPNRNQEEIFIHILLEEHTFQEPLFLSLPQFSFTMETFTLSNPKAFLKPQCSDHTLTCMGFLSLIFFNALLFFFIIKDIFSWSSRCGAAVNESYWEP